MTLRLIDNKRIELTDDEFTIYQNICKSYSRDNFDGKNLFTDLFETDENGLIVLLKPPKKMFSMEVVLFLQNIMVQQHLRRIYADHNEAMAQVKKLLSELKEQHLSESQESSEEPR